MDEAFSAYIASHRTLTSLLTTLIGGDSSDLQAFMYYIYLHAWTTWAGFSEIALRAANIPFMFIFSFTLVWTSWRVFRSRWLWIAPACLPFLWVYGPQVRVYFALVTLGTICFSSLLAYLESPTDKERRIFSVDSIVHPFGWNNVRHVNAALRPTNDGDARH